MAGKKYDKGKPTPQFIDPMVLMEESAVMAFGAAKYSAWNYTEGMSYSRLIGAALRHTLWLALGVNEDKETGLSHEAHGRACFGMLYTMRRMGRGEDDRLKADAKDVADIYKKLEKAIEAWEKSKDNG